MVVVAEQFDATCLQPSIAVRELTMVARALKYGRKSLGD